MMEVQITFIFILILFIDSVNRVYRVQVELAATKEKGQKYVSKNGCMTSSLTSLQCRCLGRV